MNNVDATLSISIGDANNLSIRGFFKTHNDAIKTQLEKLGHEFELCGSKDNEYYSCKISGKEDSSQLNNVRSVLLDAGVKEATRTIIPKDDRKDHFAFKYIRNFTKRDLDRSEYLRMNVKGIQRIAVWKDTISKGFVLKSSPSLKNSLDFGWLDIVIVPYVSEKGREQFELERFEGIHFEPAIFDQPEKATKQLYQLTSTLTMPTCLLPRQDNDGEDVHEGLEVGARIWDDSGYVQPILKYLREEVETLGSFDIAKTWEQIGNLPQHYHHQYIVSQRFRHHLEARGARSVEFVPVALVDY